MTTYTKSTDFASKDALLSGNPSKVVKGVEIDTEFNNIASADATSLKSGGSLGTPSAGVLTNATGLPISTGVTGLGTGVATSLAVNVGSAGAPVVNGGALGTPSSGTVTNLTGTASININGTVGATTPASGAFTSLSASSTVSGSGFDAYLASPPAIGGTVAAAGTFTNLTATGNATIGDAEATDTHAINGATTVLANSANPALKVTQTGSGNAFVVEDAASDATPFVIDSAGNVGIGATPTYDLDISKTKTGTALVSRFYNAGTGAGSEASLRVVQGTVSGTISAQGDSVLYIGASSNHPVVLLQNSVEVLRISTAKEVLVTNPAGLGYGTGAGGTVTQATSRTTGVTLNKPTGAITLVSAAGSTSWQSFTVTNSLVAATDVVRVSQKSGTDKYMMHVTNVAAGSFQITFATTGGTTTEQPVFNFAVIKGVTS